MPRKRFCRSLDMGPWIRSNLTCKMNAKPLIYFSTPYPVTLKADRYPIGSRLGYTVLPRESPIPLGHH